MITPVSPLLARLIHISLSCWTTYCSFEIIPELGTVHGIGLQIQCSVQVRCFKNHLVQCELCFLKNLEYFRSIFVTLTKMSGLLNLVFKK